MKIVAARHSRIPKREPLKGACYSGPLMAGGGMNRNGRFGPNPEQPNTSTGWPRDKSVHVYHHKDKD